MNSVELIGRLTRDPEVRYTSKDNKAVVTFTLAVDDGKEETDFPRVKVFGNTAEACEKYLRKGRQVGVQGKLKTGSYKNKDGVTVYTTDVIANRVDFLAKAEEPKQPTQEAFEEIDEDVPF